MMRVRLRYTVYRTGIFEVIADMFFSYMILLFGYFKDNLTVLYFIGPLERPPLTVGNQVYVMRQTVLSIWKLGKVNF
jgi:hypothetical protein